MFIIKSNKKSEPNWSGKEWSKLPCKIYSTYDDATDAIKHYWYGGYNLDGYCNRHIIIIPITEKQKIDLIAKKQARW